jgi:hypothetical protein
MSKGKHTHNPFGDDLRSCRRALNHRGLKPFPNEVCLMSKATGRSKPAPIRWCVIGAFMDSGEDVELVIEAIDQAAARDVAHRRGVAVTSVRPEIPIQPAQIVEVRRQQVVTRPPTPLREWTPGPVPAGHSANAPTVNVNMPRSNSEAVAGMIMGIMACLGGCIPVINFLAAIVGAIGFVFSLSGLLSAKRRGGGGYALAGLLLSALGAGPTAFVMIAAWAKSQQVKEQTRAGLAEERPRPRVVGNPSMRDGKPATVGTSLSMGPAVVTLKAVRIGIPELAAGSRVDDLRESLIVRMQVRSMLTERKLAFEGWDSGDVLSSSRLIDDFGTEYRRRPAAIGPLVGDFDRGDISPGATVDVFLLFETPDPDAEWIELRLPGSVLGTSGSETFRIERSALGARGL